MTVVPTTNVMTDAVKIAEPARFSGIAGCWSVSGATERAMIAPSRAVSGI